MKKTLNSKLAWAVIGLIYIISFLGYAMWKEGAKGGDPLGYYLYLPSIFIHHDLMQLDKTLTALQERFPEDLSPSYFMDTDIVTPSQLDIPVIKYTGGLALTILPFFLVAHFLAWLTGIPPNGFSTLYVFFHYLSGLAYALGGLWLLRKILLSWFKDDLVTIGLICIGLGTNLYFFSVYHSVMAHAALFFLYSLTIYSTMLMYRRPRPGWAILLGLSLGLITLIRPSEVIAWLIPALWGISHLRIAAFKDRLNFLREHSLVWCLVAISAFLVITPQLIYWKMTTGTWLFYSYGNEGFDFLHPRIVEGIFGFKNGWLAYTPIMIIAVIGIFRMNKSHPAKWAIWTFVPLHIYIIYSWWCWYYINGFGSRPMVETYVLLSIPFLVSWQKIIRHRWLHVSTLVLCALMILQNVFNTWQYKEGLMWSEDSTPEFYFSMIGKTGMEKEDLILYDCGEYQSSLERFELDTVLLQTDFNESMDSRVVATGEGHEKILQLEKSEHRYQVLSIPCHQVQLRKGDYIQVQFQAKKDDGMAQIYASAFVAIRFETDRGKGLKTRRIRLNNKIANPTNSLWGSWQGDIWDTIVFRSKAPRLPEDSRLIIYFENLYPDLVYIDDLQVQVWKPQSP